MKKMTKKWDLETSNEETKPKIRIHAKKLSKIGPTVNFDLGQQQRSKSTDAEVIGADMATRQ